MRRALAVALITVALPATALAADPADKSLFARQHAHAVRSAAADRPVAIPGYLAAIAACESGGNPAAIGGGGLYRGMFQFDRQTWASLGGQGDPAAAPVAEQVRLAEALYAKAGPGQWPVCGQ